MLARKPVFAGDLGVSLIAGAKWTSRLHPQHELLTCMKPSEYRITPQILAAGPFT